MATAPLVAKALLLGVLWTSIIAVVDHFSSRMHLSHLILGAVIFTLGSYLALRHHENRRGNHAGSTD